MIGLTALQLSTLDVITRYSSKSPITGKEIANIIGLKARDSGREGADMRSIIHALRLKGYPICASGAGYWYPTDGNELSAYIGQLEGRANEQLEAVEGLKLGYSIVGQANGKQEVESATTTLFRSNGTVFEVKGNKVDEFLLEHPDAEKL